MPLKTVFRVFLLLCFFISKPGFAQVDVNGETPSDKGKVVCHFLGKIPKKNFTLENTFAKLNLPSMSVQVLSNYFLEGIEKSTSLDFTGNLSSTKFFPTIDSLVGIPIKVSGSDFVFSLLLLNNKDKSSVEITDETQVAQISQYKGEVFVNKILNNKAEGKINLTFDNSVKIVILSDGSIDRISNGKVKLKCNFVNIPLSTE